MKWLIIALLLSIFLFETAVSHINRKHSLQALPKRLQDVYDQKRYKKWLAYSLDLQRFGLIEQGFHLLLLIVLLLGTFGRLAQVAATWTTHPILQNLLFLGIYQTIVFVAGIPFRIYRTFSIEERHGFNRTTRQTFLKDLALGYLLTLVLGGLIIGGINALYLKFSANLWTFITVTWAGISVLLVFIFAFLSKLFLRLFNKFTPLPEGDLRNRIEGLAASLGFNVKAISVMDASKRSTKSNAAFTGIGKTKEVILFDTLVEQMSEDEIMAVLAHELGHAVHKDTWRLLGQQILLAGVYAAGIGIILQGSKLFSAFGFRGIHLGFALILFSILFQPISLLLGIPLNQGSRRREYKADQFAATHTDPSWLVSALKVLARENLANLNPHPLAVTLYYSHPPLNERIQALQ